MLFFYNELILCVSPSAFQGFPDGATGKESTCNSGDTGDMDSIPGSRRSPGVGNGNPLKYSCLGNPMDRGTWWATVHGDVKSQTQLSNWAHTHTHTPKGQRRVISGKGRTFLALNDLVLLQKQVFLVSHYLSETCNDFTRNTMTRKNYLSRRGIVWKWSSM